MEKHKISSDVQGLNIFPYIISPSDSTNSHYLISTKNYTAAVLRKDLMIIFIVTDNHILKY